MKNILLGFLGGMVGALVMSVGISFAMDPTQEPDEYEPFAFQLSPDVLGGNVQGANREVLGQKTNLSLVSLAQRNSDVPLQKLPVFLGPSLAIPVPEHLPVSQEANRIRVFG